ncbi:ferredoxin [Actinomycetospora flava]|uniref:Ferredoxin n=1 Tax=Actinomycetospora flava TaxID=3129232 RepID=A0ABU8LYI6_9PSEU
MSYRIEVDGEICISSGRCVAEHPEVFRFDDDEVAETVPGAPTLPDDVTLRLARSCPSSALLVFDAQTGDEVDVFAS